MSSQPVEANVVLTADNTAYDQAMIASAGPTNDLAKSIDGLGMKINNLSKGAGRKLLGITAADVALISGATAAWAAYEKQTSRLQAQAAIIGRGRTEETKLLNNYKAAVKGLRSEFGTTTSEAATLVETLSKVTTSTQSRNLTDLSKVFVEMSNATGESSEGLATSMVNLQKVMGEPINSKNTEKYADMFTYLAAQTNTSAQGLIDFTAQIAPMGEQMGLSQKHLAGFATAFANAGQDGLIAGNVFNKVTGDITKAIQTGSPEIKQYANLIGITSEAFKNLDPDEKVLRIFEALEAKGAGARVELERLGLEGPRSMKAITGVINQPGGLRAGLGLAEEGIKSGAVSEGSEAAMKGITDEFSKLREELLKTAEAMATIFGPAAAKMLGVFEKMMSNVSEVVEGPLGEFLQLLMGVVGAATGGVGAMLLFAGAILKVAAAFTVWRNSMTRGVVEGFQGGSGITRDPNTGAYMARGGGYLGKQGANIAADPRSSWLQRSLYNVGQPVGALGGNVQGIFREGWQAGRSKFDPDYVPGPQRSMLSYAAGGLSRGLEQFVTPQFDQMRYENVAARKTWLAKEAPFARAADRFQLGTQMGAVGLAESQLSAVRQQQLDVRTDPFLTDAERSTRMDNLKQIREETKERLNSSRAEERATREKIEGQRAQRELNRETGSTRTGFKRLMMEGLPGVGAGAIGGIYGAGKALVKSPLGMPAAGALGMGGMAALGVENNALMFGAMGAMMGSPMTALAGAGVGLGLDVYQGAKGFRDTRAAAEEAALKGSPSEMMLQRDALQSEMDKYKTIGEQDYWTKNIPGHPLGFFEGVSPGQAYDATKYAIEGFFTGTNPQTERENALAEAEVRATDMQNFLEEVATARGTPIEAKPGTEEYNLELDRVMADITPGLEAMGTTADWLIKSRNAAVEGGSPEEKKFWADSLKGLMTPNKYTGVWDRLEAGGGVGATLVTSKQGQAALAQQGNLELAYKAEEHAFDVARRQGETSVDIFLGAMEGIAEVGVDTSAESERLLSMASRAQSDLAIAAPQLGRFGALEQQIKVDQGLRAIPTKDMTPALEAQLAQTKIATPQAFGDEIMFFRQMLQAQREYVRNRERAEDDYAEQRTYQEYDYQLGRERAEESFNRSRSRSVEDFNRQQVRAHYDFNLQRKRAEEDFNHSVNLMAKQQAQSVYNIYERVQTERISSASWILSNAQDQLARMQEQSANLDKARKLGLSNTAIQQLGLTDPAKAQELANLVGQLTPQMIRQFNKVAGTERVKAAKELFTDPSSLEWREMRRGFRLNWSRAHDDFERSLKLAQQDFKRGLGRQREDFDIMMDQQAEDYETGINRQEKAYKKSMDRSAEDMKHMADEILLSVDDVLLKSQDHLSTGVRRQARQVADSLAELKSSTKPEAIALMKDLARIFGFEYTNPLKGQGDGGQDLVKVDPTSSGKHKTSGYHEGGTVPGWSPGRDDKLVPLSGGEAIMRPEWARAMGREYIDGANHQARYGGFWLGGTMPLQGSTEGTTPSHGTNYYGASWAGDLNGPYDMSNPPAKILAWKAGKVANVEMLNSSYGHHVEINHPGNQTSLYAHLSTVLARIGDAVTEGQMLGRVGETGNAYGVHLHFEIDGGQVSMGDIGTGAGVGAGFAPVHIDAGKLLKDRYPKSEKAAYDMDGVHPLFPGMMSQVINRYARQRIKKMQRRYARTVAATGYDTMGLPAGASYGANAAGVWNALTAIGFSKTHSAGIMGNMQSESGFDPFIIQGGGHSMDPADAGSGGYGLVQWTPGSKLIPYLHKKPPSVATEVQAVAEQLAGKGTSPEGAAGDSLRAANTIREATLAFELEYERHAGGPQANRITQAQAIYNKYAADGAIVNGRQQLTVGEAGPEAVIPLNARGAEFMTDVMAHTMGGRNQVQSGRGINVYNTRVDRSTNFTGAITVQANNPHEMINKLQQRQRVMALSRPSLTGSAA